MKLAILTAALLAAALAPLAGANHLCPGASQPTHLYAIAGRNDVGRSTIQGSYPAGVVEVQDTNPFDCNGDGVPADWDGDYDVGVGGAFFGSTDAWDVADGCGYDLNVHATTGTARDATGLPVHGEYGVDDVEGPMVIIVPTNDTPMPCQTDGAITPGDDPNDCLADFTDAWAPGPAEPYSWAGWTTCPSAGGDDGYWLFLRSAVLQGPEGPDWTVTAGTLSADW